MHKKIISAIKRGEFVSDRMSYITLRGHWCHIIVLNVRAPTQDKTNDVKNSLYEKLECVFDKFPKYHKKILLADFSAKVGRELPGNESLHKISNDNGFRLVNFAHLILLDFINLVILGEEYKSQSFLLCSFLHPPVASSLFSPNILLSTLFSNTLSLWSSLYVRDQV
jgi:hypothetical protein